jgi:pimeloyl-ACP methyl ester carboxylesterase
MRPGFWGGEPALAHAPKGWLDLMQAWVAEVGQMIAWARATSAGPVALGGLSLGALTAQLAAAAARDWPAAQRPDALFLCMTSGDLLEVAFEGALARGLGVLQAVHAAGWTHGELAAYRGLLEPQGEPAPPPERIVLHLGRTDAVMPPAGGLRLADAWGVPPANRFLPRRGHFAAPLALHRDPAPLDRLAAILKGG